MRGAPRLRVRGHRVRLELSGPAVRRHTRVEGSAATSIHRSSFSTPNELGNLPGFETKRAQTGTFGGYSAIVAAGTYLEDGRHRAIVQQTVVVPSRSGLNVLQFNAESLQGDLQLIIDVSTVINQQSTIGLPGDERRVLSFSRSRTLSGPGCAEPKSSKPSYGQAPKPQNYFPIVPRVVARPAVGSGVAEKVLAGS
jgi:hypothetical protein